MKYAKDTRPKGVSHKAAEVLVEALPWIKNITGKTVVIMYGGSAMVDEQLRADVMNDIVLLKIVGVNPVIVHGGGKAITEAMEFVNLPVEFEDGGFYNVNADMVAGHIAAAIGAHKVVFLTDVDGLYENFEDKSTLISNLTLF